MSPPGPLLVWALTLVALALGLRTRVRERPRPEPGPPLALRVGVRIPVPAGLAGRLTSARVARDLGVAALPHDVDARAVARARGGWALAAAVGGGTLTIVHPAGVLAAALGMAAGAAYPVVVVARRARMRRTAIVRALPDLIEIVSECARSGLALEPGLRIATAHLSGALSDEIRRALREIDLGTPRREAWSGLARRVDAPELTGLVGSLLQADELGTPVADVLRRQAELLRAGRAQAVRQEAARAAPKVQLVVALVMVPGALLLILGVLVIQLVGQLSQVGIGA